MSEQPPELQLTEEQFERADYLIYRLQLEDVQDDMTTMQGMTSSVRDGLAYCSHTIMDKIEQGEISFEAARAMILLGIEQHKQGN